MSNLQQYQTYQPEGHLEPAQETGVRVNIYDSVTRISTVDGAMSDVSQGHQKGHSGALNPHHGTDSVLATAQNPNGLPVLEIVATTLITIDGVQASAAFWASEGRLQKAPDGTYSEATSAPVAPTEEPSEDFAPLPASDMADIAACLEGIEGSQNVDALIASGVGVAIGKVDASALLAKFQQVSGRDTDDANARLAVAQSKFQAQADKALQDRSGISANDLPAFYDYCRTHHQAQLHDAINTQVHGQSLAGWKALADRWFNETPPSIDALKAAGIATRNHAQGEEVWVRGSWMSASAAARAGLI